jgi:carboxyl-terminal processing protease
MLGRFVITKTTALKKLKFVIVALFFSIISIAQNPSYQQKLYYTCKIWGFVKYFHSNVSVCGVNWDSVLIADLPLVKAAVTNSDFNNALDTILNAAGPMALTTSPPCDTMAANLKRNLNFGWINDPIFRNDVFAGLDTIKKNFRPHSECWVQNNTYTSNYYGWLVFPTDSLILNVNDYTNFPDEWHRLLEVFVHWNIINYFNPYNYTHDEPWDSALFHNVVSIDTTSNDKNFFYAFRKITAQNNDAHTEGLTTDKYCNFPNGVNSYFSPNLILKYIPNQYVVIKSGITGITPGDAIISVNGLTTKQWDDSLKDYVSAGDTAFFRKTVSYYMLFGKFGATYNVVYLDSANNTKTKLVTCNTSIYSSYISPYNGYFANDTLGATNYTLWNDCNIGYVNMGVLQLSDVTNMYNKLQNTNSIIFDLRDYPNAAEINIANLIYPNQTTFSQVQIPDVNYPGTFYWQGQNLGVNGNPNPYSGHIILLFNELTESQSEYSCMILGAMPNVTKIGSQTAGTDGNVTNYRLNQNIYTGFTSLGIFYPNLDSTERVGIIPDSIVYPTRKGLYHSRDEVLEKALQVLGCPASVPEINGSHPEITVFPNPTNNKVSIQIENSNEAIISYSLTDVMGRQILNRKAGGKIGNVTSTQIDLSIFPSGIYILHTCIGQKQYVSKIIKL